MDKARERGLSRLPQSAGWRAALAALALGVSAAELPAMAQGAKAGTTTERRATNEKKGAHIERANRAMETHKLIQRLGSAIVTFREQENELGRRYSSLEAIESRLRELRSEAIEGKTDEIVGAVTFVLSARIRFPVYEDLVGAVSADKDPALRRWVEKGVNDIQNFLALPIHEREAQILRELKSSLGRGVRVQI
ncbi:hypothetical protein HY417_00300 [Candidatus Kaiserbacteria bacterium]|nr:hypothetical protein [Candidatus Kaiserbacteria bacterium]